MTEPKSYICDLAPYQPGLPIDAVARQYGTGVDTIIKLASNENPLGPSPKALAAIRETVRSLHRYPEPFVLLQALSARLGVGPDSLVVGNGSNDVLDLIARTYLGAGDEAIVSEYAFAMYHIAIQSTGAKTVAVPAKDYGHDLEAMRQAITANTRIIWIANPNNPTGTFIPYPEVKRFLEKVPMRIIVVLDEAYYEYLMKEDTVDTIQWLRQHPNLILVRTFSKVYGLAGLRVGYGIAVPEVAELLTRVRLPFTSNGLAAAAATAALEDEAFVVRSLKVNVHGRNQLLAGLETLGMECMPAYGNFVTVKVPDARAANEALLRAGVIVRPLAGYGLPEWLRVSVGRKTENARFLKVFAGIVA
jgi:histidinol-phosphate aminotransferase